MWQLKFWNLEKLVFHILKKLAMLDIEKATFAALLAQDLDVSCVD